MTIEPAMRTTIAIVGAGPGTGAAVGRRFGRKNFAVALISRDQGKLDQLAADLAADGVTARGFAADVTDPPALQQALTDAAEWGGPVEVLQYSPVPHRDFLKPVLETTYNDFGRAVAFSIYGPKAAVDTVLPGMRALGRGTVIVVNGGSAVHPNAAVAGTSVAFAGEGAYAQMLNDNLELGKHPRRATGGTRCHQPRLARTPAQTPSRSASGRSTSLVTLSATSRPPCNDRHPC